MPAAHLAEALSVDIAIGLTGAQAANRLAAAGPNDLPTEPPRSVPQSVLSDETVNPRILAALDEPVTAI